MAFMRNAGRCFQNPSERREVYANVGWNRKGMQRYPPYEPWMNGVVSSEDYDKLIEMLQKEFENFPNVGYRPCFAIILGIVILPLCPCMACWFMHMKQQIDAFNAGLEEKIRACSVANVRLELTFRYARIYNGRMWLDSRGQPCLDCPGGRENPYPIGPPQGYNLVFTAASDLPWPPQQQAWAVPAQPSMAWAVPAQPSMATPVIIGAQDGNGKKFCTACGTELDASAAFALPAASGSEAAGPA
eukprot:CAMPEP_0179168586 /NCGR_PEP_ID=MMETSP0796-20121207/82934_1 /TAXON_ID=73915 /ORGANISM="Pyrodinium bahamense, Strain pbaha01" /LENGTH=243 /DNA_ID=CAMNT_0020871357 /DNA_START=56 /DNA_END=784 /DNA_ORIENTATION=+